jgi:maltose alpha-D-glucosyltransferase / alpha-amylase
MRGRAGRVLRLLARRRGDLPEAARPEVEAVLDGRERILGHLGAALSRRINATRTRCHGDYHLGQLLWTGKDFVIIDVEGESFRHVSERRHRRTPLRDVASLLASLHYTSHAAWSGQTTGPRGSPGTIRYEDIPRLEPWTRFWGAWVGSAFLGAYLAAADGASFLPKAREELAVLLDVLQLQGMIDRLGYELEHRPDWVWIPLRGILRLLDGEGRV